MEILTPIAISRSAVVTRKTCEMKRYRNYHQKLSDDQMTAGIVPRVEGRGAIPRIRGVILHDAMANYFEQKDWRTQIKIDCEQKFQGILPDVCQNAAMVRDQTTLIRRIVLGWIATREQYFNDFKVVSAEQEWLWKMHPLVHQSLRLDRVLRKIPENSLAIIDFKTMKSPDKNWIERMMNSEQTHLYLTALKEVTKEWVFGAIYEGIIVGSLTDEGLQKSPFVMAYQKGDGPLMPRGVAGSKQVRIDEWEDADWLEWIIRHDELKNLFTTTGPLCPPMDVMLQTKVATIHGELRWAERMEELKQIEQTYGLDSFEYQSTLENLVEKNSEACLKYGWEYACPYYHQCWSGMSADDEMFTARVDHHGEKEIQE